jgi:hypothetical protein
MATSITLQKATPCAAAFKLAGDNGASTTYAFSSISANFAAGPLKTLLRRLATNSQLDTLNLSGSRSGMVRIRHVEGSADAQATPATRTITWTTTGLTVQAAAASVSEIEIRLAHSSER